MPFKNPHPLYGIWQGMRRRCLTPTSKAWPDYGGRGISICERWDRFENFVHDVGVRPDGHSLDRIDNDKNYEPQNCRWATKTEQQRNQRTARKVTIEGKIYLVSALSAATGLKPETIQDRAAKGMALEMVCAKVRYTFTGGLGKAISTRLENQKAMTHCYRGHEYTAENAEYQGNPKTCKACRKISREKRKLAGLQA